VSAIGTRHLVCRVGLNCWRVGVFHVS
jgi:hypothetical protein